MNEMETPFDMPRYPSVAPVAESAEVPDARTVYPTAIRLLARLRVERAAKRVRTTELL
jgi:hypothetical protein